jgi:peroxiredoxin-like protein
MHPFPHHYEVHADAKEQGAVGLDAPDVPALEIAAPKQFGGPGEAWSPETMLVGAVAGCFVLTFRAIAAASRLSWRSVDCTASGVLERVEGVTRFTRIHLKASLVLPPGEDVERARRLLDKAEKGCLVTRSLALQPELETEVRSEG